MIRAGSALIKIVIIFGEMQFLLISEIEFFHEIKCDGKTSVMYFMMRNASKR